jgi:cell wall-associated NlpC family hydrolase
VIRRRARAWAAGVAAAAIVGSLWGAPAVDAYNPSSAASYADTWATNSSYCNSHYCFGNDCASFISYALRDGGGYVQAGVGGSTTDDHNWYLRYVNGVQYTHSWSVANDLYWFQIYHYPGGGLHGTAPGTTTNVLSTVSVGDLIFYDWTSNGSMDHVAIQVAYGQDTNPGGGWYGDLVDAHNNNRKHAYWALRPYNTQYLTTTINMVQIYPGN